MILVTSISHQPACRIPLDRIDTGPKNWSLREWLDDAEIDALADTIRANGRVDVPITVRPAGGGTYELVVGLRRVTAAKRAGLQEIDAIVREISDEDALLIALREDTCRKALSTLELGWALIRLRAEWSEALYGAYRQKRLAELVGVAESSVSEPMRIAEAIPRDELTAAGEEHGVPITRLAGLGRKALRPLRAAAANKRRDLLREVARAIAEAERAQEQSLDARGLTDVALGAIKAGRRGRPAEPCTLSVYADGRLSITVRRPVGEWSTGQRQRFIAAVEPILEDARNLEGGPSGLVPRSAQLHQISMVIHLVRNRLRRAKTRLKSLLQRNIRGTTKRNTCKIIPACTHQDCGSDPECRAP